MFDSMRHDRARTHTGSHFSLGPASGGTGHLATEAVAAYVDGELRMNAHLRASAHIAECPLCAGEVDAQAHARAALQSSATPSLPEALLGHLRSIPRTLASADDEPPRRGPATRRRPF